MELLGLSQTDEGVHIDGFPDAVKVVPVGGPKAKRVADLALHRSDLEFADECLESINTVSEEPPILRQALWRSAIVHFTKCFGQGRSRSKLDARRVYKGEPPAAFANFRYFLNLRNKHFVHDENSYTQILPGVVLNRGDKPYKVEKIVCLGVSAETLTQVNFANLKLLVAKARDWVAAEFDNLTERLTKELECEAYEGLIAREPLVLRWPALGDVGKSRAQSDQGSRPSPPGAVKTRRR